jgi:heme/copper-type cytochrome/quinol oxidase subunit 3
MSAAVLTTPPQLDPGILTASVETRRGVIGMSWTIATEASLFVILFFAYFFLNHGAIRWPNPPPKLGLALIMLALLLASSAVIAWGKRQLTAGFQVRTRVAIAATILMGVVFLGIQTMEYRDHLRTLKPTTNTYGSIFYAIVSFHAAHVVAGLLILGFTLFLPNLGSATKSPHRPLRAAALYWHFVDAVWVVVVLVLYVIPNIR